MNRVRDEDCDIVKRVASEVKDVKSWEGTVQSKSDRSSSNEWTERLGSGNDRSQTRKRGGWFEGLVKVDRTSRER